MSKLVNFLRGHTSDNLFNICSFLLEHFKIKYSTTYLNGFLSNHVNPSSLLAIHDALSEYGLESVTVRKGEHFYHVFELPFICSIQHTAWSSALFTVVTYIDNDKIDYLDPLTKKIKTTNLQKFQSIDRGMITLIDSSKATDEIDLKENLVKEQKEILMANLTILLAILSLFSCGGYIFTHYSPTQSWIHLSYLLTSFLGALISLLLIWHEFDKHNIVIQKVCGNGGKKVNCNAVLSSSHSSMFGISWSTWGGAYFWMLFLVQLLYVNNFSFMVVTASLSLMAVPYVFYSIYIQWQIIKQWCLLCLGIQSVLIINALIAIGVFSQFSDSYVYDSFQCYSFMIAFLIGAFMVLLISASYPVLKSARNSKNFEGYLRVLKLDKNVFEYFLNKGQTPNYPIDNLGIIIGNPLADNEIIEVCNPYCSYCSDMHLKLERLINNNNTIRIRIIFKTSIEENDIGRKAVTHFLAIQQKYGNEFVHTALNDWYNSPYKDYEIFAKRFVIDSVLKEQDYKVTAMNKWVDSMKIRLTPTLFFNGHEFPSAYMVEDLGQILKNDSNIIKNFS